MRLPRKPKRHPLHVAHDDMHCSRKNTLQAPPWIHRNGYPRMFAFQLFASVGLWVSGSHDLGFRGAGLSARLDGISGRQALGIS